MQYLVFFVVSIFKHCFVSAASFPRICAGLLSLVASETLWWFYSGGYFTSCVEWLRWMLPWMLKSCETLELSGLYCQDLRKWTISLIAMNFVIWWRWWQNLDQDGTHYWIEKWTSRLMTVAPSWTHCSACCAAWFLWTAVSSAGDTGESWKFNTNIFHLLHSNGSSPQGNEWHRKAILQYLFWTNFSYGCV